MLDDSEKHFITSQISGPDEDGATHKRKQVLVDSRDNRLGWMI